MSQCKQTSMSACLTMETVNTLVPTLRAASTAPVTLAMNWTAMDQTAQVDAWIRPSDYGILLHFDQRKQYAKKTYAINYIAYCTVAKN